MKLKTKIGVSLLMGATLGYFSSSQISMFPRLIGISAAFCAVMKTTKLRGFENPEDMNCEQARHGTQPV